MTGIARIGMIGIAVIGLCRGQQFEVASVKPSGTPPRSSYKIDSARVELGGYSLRSLILQAYRLGPFQLDGPDWMSTTLVDLQAKLPAGATKEQVPEMLQALLKDRFKLVAHHVDKEQQIYALLPGKDGPKLNEGDPDNSDKSFLDGRTLLTRISTAAGDGIWTVSAKDQRNVFNAPRISMQELAGFLFPYLDDPVIDMTGLKGFWQVRLEIPRKRPRIEGRIGVEAGTPADPDGDVSIISSIQKLGLVLEHRKAPVDHLVVDSAEKVPTEN